MHSYTLIAMHVLEVGNIDIMSLINMASVSKLGDQTLFSMVSQWLPYSTVNLTLFDMLEICQHDRWAQHHHNNTDVYMHG